MIGVFICLSFKILGFRRDPERICFRSIPMKFYLEVKNMKKGLSIALIFCFVLGLCAATLAEPPAPIPTLDIPVVKTWDDEGHETQRPEKVTVRLMRGATEVSSVDLISAGGWAGTFRSVPEYDANGAPIQYTVEEDPLTNYTPSYVQPQPASLTVGGLTRTEPNSTTTFDVSTNLIIAKKGDVFYLWTETALNAQQRNMLLNAVRNAETTKGDLGKLTVKSKNIWSGFGTFTTEENKKVTIGKDENAAASQRYIDFHNDKSAWSWFYLGALSLVDATGATVKNTYVAPTTSPTPTVTPSAPVTPTPTVTPSAPVSPTPSNDPTPAPTPTPDDVPVPTLPPLNPPQTGGRTSAMILLVSLAGVSLFAFAARSRKRR